MFIKLLLKEIFHHMKILGTQEFLLKFSTIKKLKVNKFSSFCTNVFIFISLFNHLWLNGVISDGGDARDALGDVAVDHGHRS
jgi:hypothetical protein